MSFIERERDKLNELLRNTPVDSPAYLPLHAAQQALSWALDPDAFASPTRTFHRHHQIGDQGTEGTGVEWAIEGRKRSFEALSEFARSQEPH